MYSMHTYEFKTTPYDHQRSCLAGSWERPSWAHFLEMGLGKTKIVIDNMALLYEQRKIFSVLVIAPKGVYRNWVEKEIPEHLPERINRRVAYWSSSLNRQQKEAMERVFERKDNYALNILVMNVEAFSTERGAECAEKFLQLRPAMIIIDEATSIKNKDAKRTKRIIKLRKLAAYRRVLTGSPVTKSPLDLYTQCEFLDPALLGFNSFYSFRARYAVVQDMPLGNRSVKVVVGYRRLDELQQKLSKFSYRLRKEDCLDLPEKIYETRSVELTPEQKKLYDEMRQYALAELEPGKFVSATSTLSILLRLHQISCGYLPDPEGETGGKDIPNNRINELLECLEEVDGKVIIWANYRANLKLIYETLCKKYGKESCVHYYGDTSQEERERAKVMFQDPTSPVRFFIGNQQTGGYGITLTEARTVIYYSNNYDLEKRLQSEDRAHRIGQKFPVTYIYLVAKGTIDEKIISSLRRKIVISNEILGDTLRDWIK